MTTAAQWVRISNVRTGKSDRGCHHHARASGTRPNFVLRATAWSTGPIQELIQEVKPRHQWTLTLDKGLVPNTLQPGWTQYQQWAFARFKCSLCFRSWASAQVCVLSHMHWSKIESRGQVKMRIFTQRCKKCSQPPFEVPEFTEENMSRILNNLVLRILKNCYREGSKSVEIPTIKDTTLQGPHDMNNCEACLQGSCAQSRLGLAKQSPVSPSLPSISSPSGGIPAYQPSPARSSSTGDGATRGSRVKRGTGSPSPWFPEPPLARTPRANTTYRTESVIHVPSIQNSYPHVVRNRTPWYASSGCKISSVCCCNSIFCCCLIILILAVVLWWSFS
ncbi:receptor-transporting protein 3 [Artibeus jamaicensis]|uniref:receptor-transporting protein 3 n=1 Tax=Artibeus jamaicensis TaxID=9417 RepID=UPI00235AAA6A|nr:receptor-transporting protein 3 [Artibeus jamaicensis]